MRIIKRVLSKANPFLDKKCLCCGYRVNRWLPWGSNSGIYKEHTIIGGGRRDCLCPICGAIDRHRWLEYVLTNYTDIYSSEKRVLHFAPEKSVRKKLENSDKCWYISGDIDKDVAPLYLDVLDIPFKDKWFDYIIINHVVSYIKDEKKCFDELKRCLKDEGILIMSFPVRMDVDTYSRYDLSSEESEREFGTANNCRMYGRDFKEYLKKYGIDVYKTYSPAEMLNDDEIDKYGLLSSDLLIFARKNDDNE